MLITFDNVSFKYIDKPILNEVSFTINDNEKIGFVGINGTGKSTLLKLIAGEIEPTNGIIYKKNGLRISYLPQNIEYLPNNTILEEIARLTKDADEFNMKSILNKLGLTKHDQLIKELSGGEKKRLGLACTLISPSDLMLLDEPTNHLDIWMINWLEKYLIKYNKALLLVTHDRYFLERVTSKIMELEYGNIHMYEGNYQVFLDLKSVRLENLKANERKLSSIFRREMKWMKMNPQARSTKSVERIERFQELSKQINSVNSTIRENETQITLNSKETRMGKKTIEIKDLTKSLGGKILFKNFNYMLYRYDRLGIVGANGSGKTTLFKTILGLIEPDFGTIESGTTINIGYFNQECEYMDDNMRIIDYIKEKGEYITTIEGTVTASQFLENYLFTPNQQYMAIKTLSGGEKRRLQLVRVLISNPNVLFLDEPTNDLDIYTLEILEDYLENFKGAIVVVSHDRYFLDKIADHLIAFEDNGVLHEYLGFVTDYINTHQDSFKASDKKSISNSEKENIPRFTSSEKKEFDNIEKDIALLESKLKALDDDVIKYGNDYQKLMDIEKQKDELNNQIEKKINRWEELSEINEKIIKYKESKYKSYENE